MEEIRECKYCINNTLNPSITINEDGVCNVCAHYKKYFNKKKLDEELKFVKSLMSGKKYDCMVAVSGGKDSSSMLYSVKKLGFTPLAFSFKIGYNKFSKSLEEKIERITRNIGVDYIKIDANKYINEVDRECFKQMSDLYDEPVSEDLKKKFMDTYKEGRKHYSTKENIVFPYVRPCQICRKIAVRAYYEEAAKRGIKVVFVGINEWASCKNNEYSAIRKLRPFEDKPEVYIVHLPFLIQRKYEDLQPILEKIEWNRETGDHNVDTGGSACLLAKACEKKACELLGFHLDSSRLSREITVGFIDKTIAKEAIKNGKRDSDYTVKEILEMGDII